MKMLNVRLREDKCRIYNIYQWELIFNIIINIKSQLKYMRYGSPYASINQAYLTDSLYKYASNCLHGQDGCTMYIV